MLTIRESLLGDMADVCARLARTGTLASEAQVALNDGDFNLALTLTGQARGVHDAVEAMLALMMEKANAV